MKLKYIYSMFAGLLVMTATACNEEVSAVADKEPAKEAKAEEAGTETPAADAPAPAAAPSAYYVMFKGDGG